MIRGYLLTVAAILYDGYIIEEDIKDFSEVTKEVIRRRLQFLRERSVMDTDQGVILQ
jgi:transcription initiation factor IIE alpha subunit